MRRSAAWALVLALAAAPLAASGEVAVWIERPFPGESVFGEVEVLAAVQSDDPVARLEVHLDGELVATMVRPPWRAILDLGYENRAHRIEVVARSVVGHEARASVETRPIQVDESIELPLRQLYVTVSEGSRRVLDLSRDDFRVSDGGERQRIVTFERGDVPLTAVLLLDCSLSMKGDRLDGALRGARVFLEEMHDLDEAKVVLFSDRLLRESAFSEDPADLEPVLAEVDAIGGTALNDHLFLALKQLDARQGRRVVVLFTDGSDVHSALRMEEVLRKAQISPALIYWIFLQDRQMEGVAGYTSSWRDADGNRREHELLERAIRDSGGRIRPVATAGELEEAFSEILAELREQYVLGYYPTDLRRDGGWREVRVRVSRSGTRVRTRDGYLDY